MIYLFDKKLKLEKIVTSRNILSGFHEQELNNLIISTIELDLSYSEPFIKKVSYLGYYYENNFQLHRIKRIQKIHEDEKIVIDGRHIFFDDMLGYNVIKDFRPQNQDAKYVLDNTIGTHTRWNVKSTDVFKYLSGTYYYQLPMEILNKVVEEYGIEYEPEILFDGQNINGFNLHIANRLGTDTNKRIPFGSRVLNLKHEMDYSEIATAIIGRGKGEEVGDGYGRRIEFTDLNFSKNGVVSPVGKNYMEDPSVTALYGYNDGQPKFQVIEFEDIDKIPDLAQATYEYYLEASRPKMLFEANVSDIGKVSIGDSLIILRSDYNIAYSVRIHKIKVDLLNPEDAEVELGDYAHFKESKVDRKTRQNDKQWKKKTSNLIEERKREANERIDLEVKQINQELEQAKQDVQAEVTAAETRMKTKLENQKSVMEENIKLAESNAIEEAKKNAALQTKKVQDELNTQKEETDNKIVQIIGGDPSLLNKDLLGVISDLEDKLDTEQFENLNKDYTQTKTDLQNQLNEAKKDINSIDTGGRNLIPSDLLATSQTTKEVLGDFWADRFLENEWVKIYLESNTEYTMSYEIEVDEINAENPSNQAIGKLLLYSSETGHPSVTMGGINHSEYIQTREVGKTYKVSRTFTTPDISTGNYRVLIYSAVDMTTRLKDVLKFKKIILTRGNISIDYSPAPEDIEKKIGSVSSHILQVSQSLIDAQGKIEDSKNRIDEAKELIDVHGTKIIDHGNSIESINGQLSSKASQTQVDSVSGKVNSHETLISQNAKEILTKANQTEVDTIKNSVKDHESRINQSAKEISTKVTSTEVEKSIDDFDKKRENQFGYKYYTTITLNGDHDKYYPVVVSAGGNQTVKRDILIKRSYSELHPPEWYSSTHGGGLTLLIKTNFGGWGGAQYSWEIHELEQQYNDTFAYARNVASNMAFAVFLRGGGTTGSIYHIYSDQPLEVDHKYVGKVPRTFYSNEEILMNHDNPSYVQKAPSPLTEPNEEEIKKRNFIKLSQDSAARIVDAETDIIQNSKEIALKATKKEVDTLSGTVQNHDTRITQTAEDIKSKADTTTVNALSGKVSDHSSLIQQNAKSIESKVTKEEFEALEIGDRNLLLESGSPISSSSYNVVDYTLADKIKDGETVTAVFKAKLGEGKTHFQMYNSGGSGSGSMIAFHRIGEVGESHIYSATFQWKIPDNDVNDFARIYHMPSSIVSESTIEWAKLVRGNKATSDWSSAQEDIDNKIEDVKGTLKTHETSIEQNAKAITSKASVTEMDSLRKTVNEHESKITQTANEITSKVSREELENVGRWEKMYRVNTGSPLELTTVDGNSLDDLYTYEVSAKVSPTGTNTSAIAIFKSNKSGSTSGSGWELEKIHENGVSSNHPEFFINENGNPSIRLYGHDSFYNVYVVHERTIGRENSTTVQNKILTQHSTEIEQNAESIIQKADQKVVDSISGKVDEHGTKIEQNAQKISSKADQKQVDTISGTVSNHSSLFEQTAKDITSKVSQTDFESFQEETGTENDESLTILIPDSKDGSWLRVAANDVGGRGSRAHGRFIIADKTSGQHGTAEIIAGINYGRISEAELVLNNFAKYTTYPFTKARIISGGTYDPMYFDIYYKKSNTLASNVGVWLKDNIQDTGWKLSGFSDATVPTGYSIKEIELSSENSLGGKVESHDTSITQNAKEIALKASKSSVDSLTGTVTSHTSSIKQNATNISAAITKVGDAEKKIVSIEADIKGVKTNVSDLSNWKSQKGSLYDQTAEKVRTSVWKSDIEDLKIGGKNLLRNSDISLDNVSGWNGWNSDLKRETVGGKIFMQARTTSSTATSYGMQPGNKVGERFSIVKGRDYIISFEGYNSLTSQDNFTYTYLMRPWGEGSNQGSFTPYKIEDAPYEGNEWNKRFYFKFNANWSSDNAYLLIGTRIDEKWQTEDAKWMRVRNIQITEGTKEVPYSKAPEDYLQHTDFVLQSDGFLLGTTHVGGDDFAAAIVGNSKGLSLIGDNIDVNGNLSVQKTITATALDAIDANFARVQTAVLKANVIDGSMIQTDVITSNHIRVSEALVERIMAKHIFTWEVEAVSINAVHADLTSVTSKIMEANIIKSKWLDVDTALFNRFTSSTAFISSLTAKTAFITDINAIEIKANSTILNTMMDRFGNVSGGLSIRRPDGVYTINNGLVQFSLNIQRNVFMSPEMSFEGQNYHTESKEYQTFENFYTYHDARYLYIRWATSLHYSAPSTSSYVWVRAREFSGGSIVAEKRMFASRDGGTNYYDMKIDLGKPTYTEMQFYLEFKLDDTYTSVNKGLIRVNRVHMKG